MTDLLKVVTEATERYVAARDELRKLGKEAGSQVFLAFMKKYPEVQAITWTQYTPYFNDGDACVFGVNDLVIHIKEVVDKYLSDSELADEELKTFDDYIDYTYGWYETADENDDYLNHHENLRNDFLMLRELMHGNDEFALGAFGDHVRVLVTQDNVEVEEYDHD